MRGKGKKTTSIPTLEEFLECCRAECDFLIHDYGFERLSLPLEYNAFSLRFRKGDLEVDIYGENWGATASCDLIRGRDNLYFALLIPAAERQVPKSKPVSAGQLARVRNIAALLKQHASDFLSGDLTRFETALAEWRRITRPREVTEAHRREREKRQALTAAGHASKRGNHAEVVKLLEPYAVSLSLHQRRLLERARHELEKESGA
jgi:hypothetical protein